MEFVDLKNKGDKELLELLSEQRNRLRELRFQVSERQLKKVHEIREIKKTIARILTLLRQKLAAQK